MQTVTINWQIDLGQRDSVLKRLSTQVEQFANESKQSIVEIHSELKPANVNVDNWTDVSQRLITRTHQHLSEMKMLQVKKVNISDKYHRNMFATTKDCSRVKLFTIKDGKLPAECCSDDAKSLQNIQKCKMTFKKLVLLVAGAI